MLQNYWRMSPHDQETSLAWHTTATTVTYLFLFRNTDCPCFWAAGFNNSLPVTENVLRGCHLPTMLESWENGSNGSAMLVCIHMLPSSSEQVTFRCCHCTEVTVKLCRRCCLGCIDATCVKFDNDMFWKPITGQKIVQLLSSKSTITQ